MPSNDSTLLNRLSSKLSSISPLPSRLRQKCKPSHAEDLPITRSSLAFYRERGRKLTQDEANVLYSQAQRDIEAAPAPAADTRTSFNNEDEAWPGHLSKTESTSGTDLCARYGNEDWRQDWEPIKMLLQQGAQRRVMVTTVDREPRDSESGTKQDPRHCDYDYSAAIRALEAREELEPEEDEGCGAEAFLARAGERFERAKRKMRMVVSKVEFGGQVRQLRKTALGGRDDEEEEEIVYSGEGWRAAGEGDVVCGDAWWKYS
ncbi:hypothetical protein GJ744_003615 [Endocarpon pusillum]|uniref:Uncharacterized protein n=1 Tax=Endocarpon pusillum TaxID=364733 RepID=A0A8H7AAH3_9EURO|nr:hypothetical protein GJ744_003615 [Endocarpon pusillum]